MNIILSIIAFDLKQIFILQKEYLVKTKKLNDDSFYNSFDLDNDWIFFCMCVYDKLKKFKIIKDKQIPYEDVNVDDIINIIEDVKQTNIGFMGELKKSYNTLKMDYLNYLKSKYNTIITIADKYNKIKATLTNGINYIRGIKKEPTDCVKKLFSEFMLILFQYNTDKFPITINATNVGDSTKLQFEFETLVKKQSQYYFDNFDDKIKIAFLTKEISSESNPNNTTQNIKKLESQLEEAKKKNSVTIGGNRNKTKKLKPTKYN